MNDSPSDATTGPATRTTLRILDPRLSQLLTSCSKPDSLRRFARACAELAVQRCELNDQQLEQALQFVAAHLQSWPDEAELAPMRRAVWAIAKHWDDVADEARAEFEVRHGDEPHAHEMLADVDTSLIEYRSAFSKSRAATSVFRCLEQNAMSAATLACYESFHATQAVDELIRLGEAALQPDDE